MRLTEDERVALETATYAVLAELQPYEWQADELLAELEKMVPAARARAATDDEGVPDELVAPLCPRLREELERTLHRIERGKGDASSRDLTVVDGLRSLLARLGASDVDPETALCRAYARVAEGLERAVTIRGLPGGNLKELRGMLDDGRSIASGVTA
jgi:hypothetical protein